MNPKFLVPAVFAVSLLAVPATMAQDSYRSDYRDMPITGARLTDMPSMRANTTRTGSFLSEGSRYQYRERGYYREGDGYRDRDDYRDRYYDRDRDYRQRDDNP